MKTLLTLASAFMLSASVSAAERAPEYYAAHFEVESVKPMCPRTVPNGAVCMGIGSIVTLRATLGCLDKLLFVEAEERMHTIGTPTDLYVVSVVKKDPRSDVVRCIRANTVKTTITVPVNTIDYNVINLGVEAAY